MSNQQSNNTEQHKTTPSFGDKIDNTKKNIRMYDLVRYIHDGQVKHEGRVIGLTDSFAKIYRQKKNVEDVSGDVSPESAEWFPIQSKLGGIVIVNN